MSPHPTPANSEGLHGIFEDEPGQDAIDTLFALFKAGKFSEADSAAKGLISRFPSNGFAWKILGAALQMQKKSALSSMRRAITLLPDDAEGHHNYGIIQRSLEELEGAQASYLTTLTIKPEFAEAYSNLSAILFIQGYSAAAETACRRALICRHELPDAHWNLALALLRKGDFEQGWNEYEWGWKCNGRTSPHILTHSSESWTSANTTGKKILLWTEQGYGDSIQFVRFAQDLRRLDLEVSILTPHALVRLFESIPGIRVIPEGGELPQHDAHCPLLSLPRALGTTLRSIPAATPYLAADSRLAESWKGRLAGCAGLKVGVNWRGRSSNKRDPRRSMRAQAFAHFLDIPGLTIVSLQKDGRPEEIAELSARAPVVDAGTCFSDFAETAATMVNLDLVISVDTAVCHLAGALGIPTWTLLDFSPDWRWMIERTDSPWYPTMRLFRQPSRGDWESVVENVRTELTKLVKLFDG